MVFVGAPEWDVTSDLQSLAKTGERLDRGCELAREGATWRSEVRVWGDRPMIHSRSKPGAELCPQERCPNRL